MRKWLLLGVVCLVGCRTVHDAREAQKGNVLLKGEKVVTAAELGLTGGKAISLKELEKIALTYNPDVVAARESVESANLSVKNAKAGNYPSVTSNFGYSRSTNNVDPHHQSIHPTSGHYSGGVNLTWTIVDFGRTRAEVKQARENLRAAFADLRKAQIQAVYNVRVAYFELLRCQELDKVAQDSVSQYKEHLEQIREKRKVGKSNAYAVLKAEVDWNNAVLEQITTDNNLQNAWGTLANALGLAEEADFEIGDGSVTDYDLDMDALMAIANDNDPMLASLNAKVDAASYNIDRAIADLYPQVTVNLGLALNPGHTLELPWLWNLSGGASIAETLFSGGRKLRAIDEAVIMLRKARIQVTSRRQVLYQNLRKAILVARRAQKQLEVSELAEKQALENLNLINEQFRVGKASSVERTDAQVSYSKARASLVSAKYDRQDAMAAIANLIGDLELPEEDGGTSK